MKVSHLVSFCTSKRAGSNFIDWVATLRLFTDAVPLQGGEGECSVVSQVVPVRSLLGKTETPGYTRNTFLMPNIARTPDQHRSNSCRAPSLKPSSNSRLHGRLDYRPTSLSPAKICGTISCCKAESDAPPIWRHFFNGCVPGDVSWSTIWKMTILLKWPNILNIWNGHGPWANHWLRLWPRAYAKGTLVLKPPWTW